MLTKFICTDGVECPVTTCLADGGCRMSARCAPLAYLQMVGHTRPWNGKCSVTQLINGTRNAYLSIVTDYSAKPADSAFAVIGSRGHTKLEKEKSGRSFAEETLTLDGIVGTFDSLEFEGDEVRLIDTKTAGSFAVARALGIKRVAHDVPLLDENNQPVLLKSGSNKGKPKTRKEYEIVRVEPEMRSWVLQLNMYRLMVEDIGYKPTALTIFVIPRDGGTWKAEGYGITEKTYMIPVPFLDRGEVLSFFHAKRDALTTALETKTMPPLCSPEECWDGRRCTEGYCPGSAACLAHVDNPYFDAEVPGE